MLTIVKEKIPAKAFKLKANGYYIDMRGRIYGPMLASTAFDVKLFSCPGHSTRWHEDGTIVQSAHWFSKTEHPSNLIAAFKRKRKNK